MRTNLAADPAVKALVRALKLDAFSIVGRLHALWAWADEHSEDGTLPYITSEDIDDLTGKRGFAAQLHNIGWLTEAAGGLALPHFDRHNGSSAKRRATETERKRSGRNADNPPPDDPPLSAKCPQTSGHRAPESGTREEKRREEERRGTEVDLAPAAPDARADAPPPARLKLLPSPADAPPPRARNVLLDALASATGSDPAQVPPTAWSGIATALAQIRSVCPEVTPEELHRRAAHYRAHMRGATLTATALAKHWALCDRAPTTTAEPSKGRALFA